jgi:DNA topoisomerase IB
VFACTIIFFLWPWQDYIQNIAVNYTKDLRSKDQMKKQIAVATYLIDKLALRAGDISLSDSISIGMV